MKLLKKKDPKEFLNLLEQALEKPPSFFTPCLVEPKPLELKTSPVNDACQKIPLTH